MMETLNFQGFKQISAHSSQVKMKYTKTNFPGRADTPAQASNLIDEIFKKGEIETEQQYRNAVDKFYAYQVEFSRKLSEKILLIRIVW